MKYTTNHPERALVLWLSGARLADLCVIPDVARLLKRGALVELDPLPITGRLAQHYQLLSGRQPGGFGFFDTLVPHAYSVKEENTPRGPAPKLLPEQLRAAGWDVQYIESVLPDLSSHLVGAREAVSVIPSCLFLKCSMPVIPGDSDGSAIAEALRLASDWVGDAGLLAVFSDSQPAPVTRYVNLNNFLAEIDVIERDADSGVIDWSNSLAYAMGHGQLWINRLGREPQGIVSSLDEYEEIRDTLIKVLPARCRDTQTGEQVIDCIYRKEELYPADYQFCAPDLVIVFKAGYVPSPRSARLEFDDAVYALPAGGAVATEGVHPSQTTGFSIISAPAMVPGGTVSEHAALTSVAPTLLYALGIVPNAMDNSPVNGLFLPSYLDAHPLTENAEKQELSEEEEELVIARLRDLGYI